MKDKEFSARKIVWISLQNDKEIFSIRDGTTSDERLSGESLFVRRLTNRRLDTQLRIKN